MRGRVMRLWADLTPRARLDTERHMTEQCRRWSFVVLAPEVKMTVRMGRPTDGALSPGILIYSFIRHVWVNCL